MKTIRAISLLAILLMVFAVAAAPVQAAAAAKQASPGPVGTNLFGLDGLFFTTTGTTLPAGSLLVGGSMLVVSDDLADGQATPVGVTYGFTDLFEGSAAFDVYRSYDDGTTDESGTGDLYLSLKYAAQPRTAVYPATAVGARLKIPTADEDKGLGSGESDIAFFAAVDLAMDSVQGLLNVEYVLIGGDGAENEVNYAVGLRIPYSDTVDFTIELVDQPLVGDVLAGGATFDMGTALNFGFAVGVGLTDESSADFAVQGKFTLSL